MGMCAYYASVALSTTHYCSVRFEVERANLARTVIELGRIGRVYLVKYTR